MTRWLSEQVFDFDRAETPGELVFFKVFELFLLYAAIASAWEWGLYLERIEEVVLPVGIARHLDVSIMFGRWQGPLVALLVSGAALVGFFRASRFAWLVALGLLMWSYAARFCLGQIPHSANLIGMIILGLGLAHVAFDTPRLRRRFTLGFAVLSVGLAYTSAGVCKLVASGITWPHGRHLRIWIHEKAIDAFSKTGVWDLDGLQRLVLEHRALGTLVLGVGLATELLAFSVWWKKPRPFAIAALVVLHLGIFHLMEILFRLNLYVLVLLGLPWSSWLDRMMQSPEVSRALGPVVRLSARWA